MKTLLFIWVIAAMGKHYFMKLLLTMQSREIKQQWIVCGVDFLSINFHYKGDGRVNKPFWQKLIIYNTGEPWIVWPEKCKPNNAFTKIQRTIAKESLCSIRSLHACSSLVLLIIGWNIGYCAVYSCCLVVFFIKLPKGLHNEITIGRLIIFLQGYCRITYSGQG